MGGVVAGHRGGGDPSRDPCGICLLLQMLQVTCYNFPLASMQLIPLACCGRKVEAVKPDDWGQPTIVWMLELTHSAFTAANGKAQSTMGRFSIGRQRCIQTVCPDDKIQVTSGMLMEVQNLDAFAAALFDLPASASRQRHSSCIATT